MVETGLFELRGHQVRMFYIFLPGRRAVMLDGMIKKQDGIPSEVLERVRTLSGGCGSSAAEVRVGMAMATTALWRQGV